MLHPTKYAAMLAEKMKSQGATGWLVNTGWSGGRYICPSMEIDTTKRCLVTHVCRLLT